MKITRGDLKSERVWRATIGMGAAQFDCLLPLFSDSYLELFGGSVTERQEGLQVVPSLASEEALLLFTLFCYKCGLVNDVIGVVTGMDASNVQRNRDLGTKVLSHAMALSGFLPRTSFESQEAFEAYFSAHKQIIIDGQEQPTVRPQDPQQQRDNYSGKKNAHH